MTNSDYEECMRRIGKLLEEDEIEASTALDEGKLELARYYTVLSELQVIKGMLLVLMKDK